MKHIFLSYSRKDIAAMKRIKSDLELKGFRIWTDEELKPGTPEWKREIENKIKKASILIVLLSPDANSSTWVGREIGFAQMLGIDIIPIWLRGNEENSISIDLVNYQRVDMRTAYEPAFAQLVDAIGGERETSYRIFSLEEGTFDTHELERRLRETFNRPSELTPRFVYFVEILLSENRIFSRDEIKKALFAKGVGSDLGYAGRLLSGISQFLTKPSNPHLRQVIEFKSDGNTGDVKGNYHIVTEYRPLLQKLVDEWNNKRTM